MTKFTKQSKPKKRKTDTDTRKSVPDDETEDASPAKKIKTSSATSSSSIVVEQLVKNDRNIAFDALAALANDEEKIEEFFAGGGNVKHVLHYLDTAEEKTKANEVAAVFNTIEAIVSYSVRYGGWSDHDNIKMFPFH